MCELNKVEAMELIKGIVGSKFVQCTITRRKVYLQNLRKLERGGWRKIFRMQRLLLIVILNASGK